VSPLVCQSQQCPGARLAAVPVPDAAAPWSFRVAKSAVGTAASPLMSNSIGAPQMHFSRWCHCWPSSPEDDPVAPTAAAASHPNSVRHGPPGMTMASPLQSALVKSQPLAVAPRSTGSV